MNKCFLKTALLSAGLCLLSGISSMSHAKDDSVSNNKYVLVIHGGAGVIEPENLTKEQEVAFHADLKAALLAGEAVLKQGGTALEVQGHMIMHQPIAKRIRSQRRPQVGEAQFLILLYYAGLVEVNLFIIGG